MRVAPMNQPPQIQLPRPIADDLARQIAAYLRDEMEAEITPMDSLRLIDFLSERLGPHYYNQGLADAQAILKARLDSIGEAIDDLEKPVRR